MKIKIQIWMVVLFFAANGTSVFGYFSELQPWAGNQGPGGTGYTGPSAAEIQARRDRAAAQAAERQAQADAEEQRLEAIEYAYDSTCNAAAQAETAGRMAEAEADIRTSLQMRPGKNGFAFLGDLLVKEGRYDEAAQAFQQSRNAGLSKKEWEQWMDYLHKFQERDWEIAADKSAAKEIEQIIQNYAQKRTAATMPDGLDFNSFSSNNPKTDSNLRNAVADIPSDHKTIVGSMGYKVAIPDDLGSALPNTTEVTKETALEELAGTVKEGATEGIQPNMDTLGHVKGVISTEGIANPVLVTALNQANAEIKMQMDSGVSAIGHFDTIVVGTGSGPDLSAKTQTLQVPLVLQKDPLYQKLVIEHVALQHQDGVIQSQIDTIKASPGYQQDPKKLSAVYTLQGAEHGLATMTHYTETVVKDATQGTINLGTLSIFNTPPPDGGLDTHNVPPPPK